MAFESPNYTQVPNDLLGDILKGNKFVPGFMATLTGAELKIILAVTRATIGFHQTSRRISLNNMRKLTGLTKQGILKATKGLEEKDLIERFHDGGVTEWQLKIVNSVDYLKVPVVNSVDHEGKLSLHPSKKETKKETDLESDNQKPTLNPHEQDNLMFFGIYGQNGNPPEPESLEEEVINSGWHIRSPLIEQALIVFLRACRESGLNLPIPNSDTMRKDWLKSLSDHTKDYDIETLENRYKQAIQKAKDGEWFDHIGRPGSLDKTLPTIQVSSNGQKVVASY